MSTINIKDIARICQVGISTVSRVLNDHPDVSSETKAKVMKVIKECNYIPNNNARNLRLNTSRTIAIIITGINNPFYTPLIGILQHEISKMNYSMILHQIDLESDEIDTAAQLIKEKNLQGIIFIGARFQNNSDRLKELTIPFVLCAMDADADDLESYSSVCINDVKESFKAVDYLCRLGHKDIAIIMANNDDTISRYRLKGYKKALKQHNIPFDESLVGLCPLGNGDYSYENGYEYTNHLLEKGQKFTAIFAVSDVLAIGACKAILDAGKSVPEDYSIIGFGNIALTNYMNPPLTTMAQPVEDIASKSVQMLFEQIGTIGKRNHQHLFFSCELIERESCRAF